MTSSDIRSIREHLDLSVEQLADILRVSARQVIAWEYGMSQIPLVYANQLTRFDRHGLGIFAPRR